MTDQRFLEDVDYDNAAIGEMLFNAYRVHVYHTPSEKACLLVSRRRQCPIKGETRCGENRETCCGKWSGAKRWKRTDKNSFGADRGSKFSPNVQAEIKRHEFQADSDRRSTQKK